MPIDWQHMSVPLGQGLETRASEKVLPPGKLTKAVNVSFKTPGALSKRPGLGDDLGFGNAPGDALATLGDHLLARANGRLYDYQPNAQPSQFARIAGPQRNPGQTWRDLGSCRSVPATSQIVKGALTDVSLASAFSVSGLRCIVWVDAATVTARIVDETSGAVISEKVLFADPSAAPISVCGVAAGVTVKFYVLFSASMFVWTSTSNSWAPLDVASQIGVLVPGFSFGTFLNTRICAYRDTHGVHGFLLLFACPTGLVLATLVADVIGWAVNYADLKCVLGPVAVTQSADFLNVYAAVVVEGDGTDNFHNLVGFVFDSGTGARGGADVVIAALKAPGYSEDTGVAATSVLDVRHITVFPWQGRAAFVWDEYTPFSNEWYADAPNATTASAENASHNKKLRRAEMSALAVVLYPEDWVRGLSLMSDGCAASDTSVLWATYAQLTIAKSATGNAQTTSLNAAHFLLDYATGDVVAKLLAEQAIEQVQTSPISVGQVGVVSAALAVARADVTQLSLQRATVAVLSANFAAERMRSAVAQTDVVLTGGSPTDFDGVSLVEQGFHVFPELRIIGKAARKIGGAAGESSYLFPYPQTGYFPIGLHNWVASAKYKVGDFVHTDVTPVLGIKIVVRPGISGAVEPAWPANGLVLDGTVLWSVEAFDTLPAGWSAAATLVLNEMVYIPSVSALLRVTTGGITGGAPPVWNNYSEGDTISDGPVRYLWVDTVSPGFYRNGVRQDGATYNSAVCAVYEYVDDRGQLHQSLPSVVQSFPVVAVQKGDIGTDFFPFQYSYLISTLRSTRKENVYIAIYRTDDNGNVLQKVGQVLNDPTVDAVVFNDDVGPDAQQSGLIFYAGQEGAGELPNEQACSCSLIQKWGHRLVINDLENEGQIRVSKLLAPGYGPAFSSELVVPVNQAFGPVTAFLVMDDKLVIFHAEHVGVLVGDGPDNTGAGQSFSPVEYLATDTGCVNPDSAVVTPGGLLFQSGKGLFGLSRSLEVGYSGSAVENASAQVSYAGSGIGFDYPLDLPFGSLDAGAVIEDINVGNIVSADIAPKSTEVRFLTDGGTTIVYDYVSNEWAVWTYGGADAIVYDGDYVVLTKDGQVGRESPGYHVDLGGTFVALAFKLASLRFDGVQGFGKIRHAALLLESTGPTAVELKIYDDYGVNAAQETAQFAMNGPQQLRVRPTRAKAQAVALEFIEVPTADVDLKVTGVDVLVGLIGKLNRIPPANRMG